MFLMLIIYNVLRTTGFGLHAKKSWQCWVSSTLTFIILPIISKYVVIPINLKVLLGIISLILIYLYAPADTAKHPLVNENKKLIWKYITVINCIILVFISLLITNNTISNLVLFGVYCEIAMIIPITYKIFNLSYNNYLSYGLNS